MGAAWRSPNDRQVAEVSEAIAAVRALGMETCATLGMLTQQQAEQLAGAGLDYYNHNLDTSSTATSSPPAPTATGSTPSPTCARPRSRCAAAASWAWARRGATERA
jgi:hypothetical protein